MNVQEVTRLIQSSDAIALLGAGLSYEAGMPLANELTPLVWSTFDENPSQRAMLANEIGIPDGACPQMIGTDSRKIQLAYDHIVKSKELRATFQRLFCALDENHSKRQSPVHDAVARLIYQGKVELAISLNWDSLLEVAYRRLYGPSINKPDVRLFKPHGDVLNSAVPWTLPSERVEMPTELLSRIDVAIRERPRILLVVGYGEGDDVIVDKIIKPMEARWQVVRISPKAYGPSSLAATASSVMPVLANALCPRPEHPGWEFVTYTDQRDLASAIAGERLGPADVKSCPRLPQVDALSRQLQQSHVGRLEGRPGSGKSISAYQAAFDQQIHGFHVLRLAEPPNLDEALESFRQIRIPSVFIIDDAQRYPSSFIRGLEENAHSTRELLVITTEVEHGAPSIRVTAAESVAAIADAYRARSEEVLEHVRRHDPRIGNNYMDEDLERRIHFAETESTLWLFNYVLRGGWRQARQILNETRDLDRADLLLLGIAALQRAGLDAPVDSGHLASIATAFEKNSGWIKSSLEILTKKRLILNSGAAFRCNHIAFADELLLKFSMEAITLEHRRFRGFLRDVLGGSNSMRGIAWLIQSFNRYDSCYSKYQELLLVDLPLFEQLLNRCLASSIESDRVDAISLIFVILRTIENGHQQIENHLSTLARWLNQSSGILDMSMSWLVGEFIRQDGDMAGRFVKLLNLRRLFDRFKCLEVGKARGFSYLVGQIYAVNSDEGKESIVSHIESMPLEDLSGRYSSNDLFDLMAMANSLGLCDLSAAERILHGASAAIDAAFASDAMDAFEQCEGVINSTLGYVVEIPGTGKISGERLQIGRKLVRAIDASRFGMQIIDPRPRQWEKAAFVLHWLEKVDSEKLMKIVELVDLNVFDERCRLHWRMPNRELRLLVAALHAGQGKDKRISNWVYEKRDIIKRIDPLILRCAPLLATYALSHDVPIDLHGHNGRNWSLAFFALREVYAVDPNAVNTLVTQEWPLLQATISNPEATDNALAVFVQMAAELQPDMAKSVLSGINWEDAGPRWEKNIQSQRNNAAIRVLKKVFENLSMAVPPSLST